MVSNNNLNISFRGSFKPQIAEAAPRAVNLQTQENSGGAVRAFSFPYKRADAANHHPKIEITRVKVKQSAAQ